MWERIKLKSLTNKSEETDSLPISVTKEYTSGDWTDKEESQKIEEKVN